MKYHLLSIIKVQNQKKTLIFQSIIPQKAKVIRKLSESYEGLDKDNSPVCTEVSSCSHYILKICYDTQCFFCENLICSYLPFVCCQDQLMVRGDKEILHLLILK